MKIEREELKNLRDALVNLMDFIDVVEQGELPEFYRYFDTMKNNIEIFICIGCDDTEDIVPVLERDWKASHTMFIGVQDYDIRENNPDGDSGLFVCFGRLLSNVGNFFVQK